MSLINKYRPKSFDQVVGHKTAIKSLETALQKGLARTFLLTGPSGVGKTTLPRVALSKVGCSGIDLIEADAATNTGIDAMRALMDGLEYRPLGNGSTKGIIVDECHALSKQAWQSLLKTLEEPPEWVYWFLCTTEPTKVPQTIKTRSLHIDLKSLPIKELTGLLDNIVRVEKIKLGGKDTDDIVSLCAEEAGGSPRQALSNLVACLGASTYEQAQGMLRSAINLPEAFDLAKALLKREPWGKIQGILKGLKDADASPESVRHVVRAYMTTTIINADTADRAMDAFEVLDAFSVPFNPQDGISPVVLACGKVLFEGED